MKNYALEASEWLVFGLKERISLRFAESTPLTVPILTLLDFLSCSVDNFFLKDFPLNLRNHER